jgi:hypothetical protein
MRFLLPLREASRPFKIDIYARESLAVSIVNGHAPMMMLASAIFAELRWLSFGHVFWMDARG